MIPLLLKDAPTKPPSTRTHPTALAAGPERDIAATHKTVAIAFVVFGSSHEFVSSIAPLTAITDSNSPIASPATPNFVPTDCNIISGKTNS